MKCFRSLIFFVFMFCSISALSRDRGVRFAYDVDFEMNFDNREFYRSDFSRSMTIFGARLTPSVGFEAGRDSGFSHKVMIGIDVMKDFGASRVPEHIAGSESSETSSRLSNLDLFREITLNYQLDKDFGDTEMSLTAGIFPRSYMKGEYSQAFFSDSLKFYDNNIEGLLLRFVRPEAEFELGCDWMGQYGIARREKFMVFSSGEGRVAPVLLLGYSAYMYHFACSRTVDGVVDNILLNPYLKLDFAHLTGFQEFTMRFAWLQSLQHDRRNVGHYVFPGGGEFDMTIRKWNVGISNHLFYGTDMMPYYNSSDAGAIKYGTRLYMGDPFYRIHDDATTGPGTYDRLDVFYEPFVGKMLKLRIAASFHFHNFAYSGCQQMVSVCFDLNKFNK